MENDSATFAAIQTPNKSQTLAQALLKSILAISPPRYLATLGLPIRCTTVTDASSANDDARVPIPGRSLLSVFYDNVQDASHSVDIHKG